VSLAGLYSADVLGDQRLLQQKELANEALDLEEVESFRGKDGIVERIVI
jgi:hypothetical protein